LSVVFVCRVITVRTGETRQSVTKLPLLRTWVLLCINCLEADFHPSWVYSCKLYDWETASFLPA